MLHPKIDPSPSWRLCIGASQEGLNGVAGKPLIIIVVVLFTLMLSCMF
jgi:hypothetical protein